MNKKKNRTDLLAAGRQKLQQFRQKKDTKGPDQKKDNKGSSSGVKPSKQSNKLDPNTSSSSAEATVSSQVSEGGTISHVEPDTRTLDTLVVSADNDSAHGSDISAPVASSEPEMDSQEISELVSGHDAEAKQLEAATIEKDADAYHPSTEVVGMVPSSKSDLTDTGKGFNAADMPVFVDTYGLPASRERVETERMGGNGEKEDGSSQHEDIPDISLIQARGDQVTDVGDLQDGDGLSLEQSAKSNEKMDLEKAAAEGTQSGNAGDVSEASFSASNTSEGSTLLPSNESGRKPETVFLKGDVADSANEGTPEVTSRSDHGGDISKPVFSAEPEDINVSDIRVKHISENTASHEEPHVIASHVEGHDIVSHEEPHDIDSSTSSLEAAVIYIQDGCSVSFLKLIDVIRGLGEEEYKFLRRSRESASVSDLNTSLVERMKEELYVSNTMKDMLQLQLREQSDLQKEFEQQNNQLLSELFGLRTSVTAAEEKNNLLTEEIDDCRSQLDAVTSFKEKLESQLLAAEAQAGEFYARAENLQLNLEKSQQEIASISEELSEAKVLLTNLQVEKETLDGIISSATADKKKLEEEKESRDNEIEKLLSELADCKNTLASLQAEINKLSGVNGLLMDEKLKVFEEKEHLLSETEKLWIELTDCKTLVSVQAVENTNLSELNSQLTEDQKQLEEDKFCLTHEIEKVYLEGDAHKIFLVALQSEVSNLMEGYTLLKNETEKLQEEKVHSVGENNRLSTELLVLQEQLSAEQVARTHLEADLEETLTRLDKLMKENVLLNNSLEVHKTETTKIDNGETEVVVGVQKQVKHADELVDLHISEDQNVIVSDPREEVLDDSKVSVMKEHLEEGENMLQNLEKAIEQIQTYSASLSKSSGKEVTPGVSKLIQAFESKLQDDEPEFEDMPLSKDRSEADPFVSVEGHIRNMRAMFEQLIVDARNISIQFKLVCDEKTCTNDKFREFNVQFKYLKEHTDILEMDFIKLGVFCEATKQHLYDVEAKSYELAVQCDLSKHHENRLRVENIKLNEKLNQCLSRIVGTEKHLDGLQQSSDHAASLIQVKLEGLQEEYERVSKIEEGLRSSFSQIDETIGRLNEYLRRFDSNLSDGCGDGLDINRRFATTVDISIKVIDDLEKKLEAACAKHETASNTYEELKERFDNLHEKSEKATGVLRMVDTDLMNLVTDSLGSVGSSSTDTQSLELMDHFNFDSYKNLMGKVKSFMTERLELQSINEQLHSELSNKIKDIEEMNGRQLVSNSFQKLAEMLEGVLNPENAGNNFDGNSTQYVETLVSYLVQKYQEADQQARLFEKELEFKEMELMRSQEELLQRKTEYDILRQSLNQAEEFLLVARSELLEKSNELELSEQRLSSIREKLSIAVAKGKGLLVQRDNLKQVLAEKSTELERCSEELKSKDDQLQEVEAKLKTYAETGERVEALESELSYIRNSATALRESFLLKDSLLQRIEEILEDLDLPEHFHSRDILEKVELLARSATGSSLPLPDWDQKTSMGGSNSDSGFAVTDSWREEVQPGSNSDDLRIKFEELQGKFYGLAEQNEMLERSLMERNDLVKRWEELLGSINIPSQLQSMEVEDKIEWLQNEFSEAILCRESLQQKIENLENYSKSLTSDLEASEKQISNVEDDLQSVVQERAHLSERLDSLISDHAKLSANTLQFELENEKLHDEVNDLHAKLHEKLGNEEYLQRIEGEMTRLKGFIYDAVHEDGLQELALPGEESLEVLVSKLIKHYKTLVKPSFIHEADENVSEAPVPDPDSLRIKESLDSEGSPVYEHQADMVIADSDEATSRDISVLETPDITSLKKDLEEALNEVRLAREERDIYMERQQSLVAEIDALNNKKVELQALLNQEEQKTASVREKLNVAVRKGKSLVQHRDSLKQKIEEITSELALLKSEISQRDNTLAEYEQKIEDLTPYPGKLEELKSECLLLRNQLQETEHLSKESVHTLSTMLSALDCIDLGAESTGSNPVEKIQLIGQLLQNMHAAVAFSEQESKKSRRAAELLVTELNEVQERNDSLQEDLLRSSYDYQQLSREKDAAEAGKVEALSHLERLSNTYKDERSKQYHELLALRTTVNKLGNLLSSVNNLLTDVLGNDLGYLHDLEAYLESCLKQTDASLVMLPHIKAKSENIESFSPINSSLDINLEDISSRRDIIDICGSLVQNMDALVSEVSFLKEKLSKHSGSWHKQVNSLSEVIETFAKSVDNGKDLEIASLREKAALLHGACANIFAEVENKKAELTGSKNLSRRYEIPFGLEDDVSSVRSMVERLSLAVKDFVTESAEIVGRNQKEMKTAVANLQMELQEKDIQKDRICTELVGQIREAEVTARNYAADLQSVSARVHDLEKQLEFVNKERNSLEERVQESSAELEEKVRSLSTLLAAKEQEIESLMQALDEEEAQMEDLTNKTKELEQELQQKNTDLQNLEGSRGKISKKLSVTMNKFDELHHLSEDLLAEIEKLQQQLQDKDAEISFLRQEVTRCTNEVLAASQINNKRCSDEMQGVLSWFDTVISLVGLQDRHPDDKSGQLQHYMDALEKKILSLISELDDSKLVGQSKDALLEAERNTVAELRQKEETLEKVLHERESQANMATGSTSEIVEVEPLMNKWTVTGTSIPSQVRSLRKGNNDQVAVTIDADQGDNVSSLEEDDDKAHGFRSLSSSRIIPRFTRPVTDMIDGLWVSCDRTLMRQPALRVSIMIYWAILHTLLAAFVV